MLEAVEKLSLEEATLRQEKFKKNFRAKHPEASGALIFSVINIYYLTGTLPGGVLWLPMEGEPVLFVRKGLERAKAETPLKNIMPLRSYGDISKTCEELGVPLSNSIGAEMGGLAWSMSQMLKAKLPNAEFVDVTQILTITRSTKTKYELDKMHIAGEKHLDTYHALASLIKPGMTEREIGVIAYTEFFKRGHAGILRMSSLGGENILGQMSSGDNSNYPTYWDGPVGFVGGHPSTPYMGSFSDKWQKNSPLVIDLGFSHHGYHTDKTQVFWSGAKSSIPDYLQKAQDVCVEIQNKAAEMLVPGTTPEAIWLKALEMAQAAGLADHFMGVVGNQVKFLGHGIGLAFDEYPPIANKFTQPLELGMTIAIEPKMGFKGVGMVGTENVFEITENGAKSITGTDFDIVCID